MLTHSANRIKFAALLGFFSRLLSNNSAATQVQQRSTMSDGPYIIKPTEKHTGTVFFLHGLGDTGQGWSVVLKESSSLPYLKFVCPNAAAIPVTLNAGFRMPSWFDIYSLSIGGREDSEGIKRATANVHSLIEKEIAAGIPSERIVLGGFSQGGALALYAGLQYPKKLAAIIGLSTWMPLSKDLMNPDAIKGSNKNTPIFQGHGDSDFTVPKQVGDMSAAFLKQVNPNATYKVYSNLGHSSNDEELRDLKKFLQTNIPKV